MEREGIRCVFQPFGPPVLQVGSEQGSWLEEQAHRGVDVQVLAHVRRTPTEAFNVTATAAGCTGALPAVMNAVLDALRPLGIRHLDMPATPEIVWRAIQAAGGG